VIRTFLTLALAAASAQEYRLGITVAEIKLADAIVSPGGAAATVVLFVGTKCPVSNRYNQRMIGLYREYSAKGVQFVFLNSNMNEPAAEVAQHRAQAKYPFPVLKDQDNVLADKFGAQYTPETFVLDRAGVVRYHGRIDDAQNEARVKQPSLQMAIDSVLKGGTVDPAETRALGCTIKRVPKTT
jgi:thiol-disulfide isomerase/thioredoxin